MLAFCQLKAGVAGHDDQGDDFLPGIRRIQRNDVRAAKTAPADRDREHRCPDSLHRYGKHGGSGSLRGYVQRRALILRLQLQDAFRAGQQLPYNGRFPDVEAVADHKLHSIPVLIVAFQQGKRLFPKLQLHPDICRLSVAVHLDGEMIIGQIK